MFKSPEFSGIFQDLSNYFASFWEYENSGKVFMCKITGYVLQRLMKLCEEFNQCTHKNNIINLRSNLSFSFPSACIYSPIIFTVKRSNDKRQVDLCLSYWDKWFPLYFSLQNQIIWGKIKVVKCIFKWTQHWVSSLSFPIWLPHLIQALPWWKRFKR